MEPTSLPSTDAPERPSDEVHEPLVKRHFTRDGEDPFDTVEWERRDAVPGGDESKRVPDLEVPRSWGQQALDIAAKLYLARGDDYREDGIRVLVERVASKIATEGAERGYFDGHDDAQTFHDELAYVCLHQLATFNSPVWFNIGREDRPQCPSACFLLGVDDTTESIMQWARDEAFIFKNGAGSGVNVSALRSSSERLSTGGISSGPVSFMRVTNAVSETFKSGGTTRRAARMVQLDADHPDIEDFVEAKPREEDVLRILGESGINIGFDLEGERNVAEVTSYQGANNSVRVTDDFMFLATECPGARWTLSPRKNGEPTSVVASELLAKIAHAAHTCADPGMMFHDTINSWHTTPSDGPIRTSNPCGETHLVDNSSCNLASVNVLKFLDERGDLRIDDLRQVVDVMTTAMDILVDFCELPTELLTKRTRRFRWLGLGLSNLGAAIMSQGMTYDSDEARDFASSFMALECGRCYRQSARIAGRIGAFDGYEADRAAMLDVMDRHASHVRVDDAGPIWAAADEDWVDARALGHSYGYRNAQATVIAPTGTTSFFLGCDTTGAEPAFGLVTYKQLAGGGSMTIVNQSVGRGLRALGGDDAKNNYVWSLQEYGVDRFKEMIDEEWHPVFASANEISAEGHIKMVAALQPFLSGAASKTINLPESATVEDVRDCYVSAWRLGVKCISVYRNNSKVRQVLSSKPREKQPVDEHGTLTGIEPRVTTDWSQDANHPVEDLKRLVEVSPIGSGPVRRRLPRTRRSTTHKIHVRSSLGEHEGYVTAGTYPDGRLGEVFLEGFGRLGGFTQNALSAWATTISISLQYGVPVDVLVRKYAGHVDETGGVSVPSPDERLVVRTCTSLIDYIARWLASEFCSADVCEQMGVMTEEVKARKMGVMVELPEPEDVASKLVRQRTFSTNGNGHGHSVEISAHTCPDCHGPLVPAGSCWSCSCGYSTGCG